MNRPYGQPPVPEPIEPRRLELSLNPEDGSLLTSPLLSVLLAATDGLYSDLYNMAHGELEVTTAQKEAADGDAEDEEEKQQQEQALGPAAAAAAAAAAGSRKEKMSNLSFAQRRHELAWRLAQHGRTLTHVSALTAAAASSDIATATRVSTHALQHARTAWVQADEAQDALYFFHAQLFPARQAPHDVYGALDTLLARRWVDLPNDLKLVVDRYDNSREKTWSTSEVADRWHMAVRDKLLRGEVGWVRRNNHHMPWNISLRGGIVRLTHGAPKILRAAPSSSTTTSSTDEKAENSDAAGNNSSSSTLIYPIEAVLTVLSTSQPAQWTLVSIEVHAQAKTGESNHQLDTSNRQRYDLHRLCALAMAKEEARQRKADKEREQNSSNDVTMQDTSNHHDSKLPATTTSPQKLSTMLPAATVARPLHSLFQVVHFFSLSWQLEILSAQAQALRKGVWTEKDSNSKIVVTPVKFFDIDHDDTSSSSSQTLGIVSISFWSVDDRYGPPSMGDLSLDDGEGVVNSAMGGANNDAMDATSVASSSKQSSSLKYKVPVSNQFTLSVRAETGGIRVSLSGAASVMEFAKVQPHIRSTIHDLLQATSNPFTLSASEALLAATRLCAERKCQAVVQALQPSSDSATDTALPPWIILKVERGSIAVAAKISYCSGRPKDDSNAAPPTSQNQRPPVVLFRLMCDARTGSFISTFPRSARLLQFMSCNHAKSAESTALRMAQLAKNSRASAARRAVTVGRAVRDAFDSLARSMNVLGQRTGVGGVWQDEDSMSASLRQRAILLACKDVRVSMINCCGMSAMYGLSAVAIGVATGVEACVDM